MTPVLERARIVVHGGVETSAALASGCVAAVDAALATLARTMDVVEAAVAAVIVLEDDPRYNAGTGSSFRLDGETIEMDAAVMDDTARIGAVGALQRVKNPVAVARAVLDSPHCLLVGAGAQRFARQLGHGDYDPATEQSRALFASVQQQLARRELPQWRQRWLDIDPERHWNFTAPYRPYLGGDTVGAVVAWQGRAAVALSTGGASPMMAGRVGDTPLPGSGFWAGAGLAVATTGPGEQIIAKLLGKWVHDRARVEPSLQTACEQGVALYPAQVPIGVIAANAASIGIAANAALPWAKWDGTRVIHSD
jgi:L-asparaginase/beta-aspartyl-peptidase (threonine type)